MAARDGTTSKDSDAKAEQKQDQQISTKQTAKKARKIKIDDFAKALPFGASRRVLPADVESLALSFLDLTSWASLFFSSKNGARTVARLLKGMRGA